MANSLSIVGFQALTGSANLQQGFIAARLTSWVCCRSFRHAFSATLKSAARELSPSEFPHLSANDSGWAVVSAVVLLSGGGFFSALVAFSSQILTFVARKIVGVIKFEMLGGK